MTLALGESGLFSAIDMSSVVRGLRTFGHPFLHKCTIPQMPKEPPKREGRLSLTIREDLLLEFKMQAVRERTSMSELVERMMSDYLKKAEK